MLFSGPRRTRRRSIVGERIVPYLSNPSLLSLFMGEPENPGLGQGLVHPPRGFLGLPLGVLYFFDE
jgi:hypothetical protein